MPSSLDFQKQNLWQEICRSAASDFARITMEMFRFQAAHNPVYKKYLEALGINPASVKSTFDIPFLPISFFKSHVVKTGAWEAEETFVSSGTSQLTASRHLADSRERYETHTRDIFTRAFGDVKNYHFFALLPSYLERRGSSLITMLQHFIERSQSDYSGFYLYDYDRLLANIDKAILAQDRKILLWGVSFALLELSEKYEINLSDCLVMETGGMKGRRKEITRQELYDILKKRLQVSDIASEYGMTELFSQAYSTSDGIFTSPWSMRVLIRDVYDPFKNLPSNKTGTVNVIDLANVHSCAFIETQDLGRVKENGKFEILGRIDNADKRGCSLLLE